MRVALLGAAAVATLALATPLRRQDAAEAMDGMDTAMAEDMDGMAMDDHSMDMDMPDLAASAPVASSSTLPPPSLASAHAHAAAATTPAAPSSHHLHNGPVMAKLDDAAVHRGHAYPPTYLDADFRLTNDSVIFGEVLPEDWDPETVPSHPGLMLAHWASFIAAYFGILPIAGHPAHYLVNGVFVTVALFGWLAGFAYNAAMPNMYEGAKRSSLENLLLLVSLALAVLDSFGLMQRGIAYYRSGARDWRSFFRDALADVGAGESSQYEMVGLMDEHGEHELDPRAASRTMRGKHSSVVFALGDDDDDDDEARDEPHGKTRPGLPRRDSPAGSSRHSTGSEGTLQDSPAVGGGFKGGAFDAIPEADEEHESGDHRCEHSVYAVPSARGYKRAVEVVVTWIRRTQVVIAYAVVVLAIPEYLGMCRGGYINTCAAHFIKGSIFFGYGVLTFARYLGAYADMGWAWNRKPRGSRACSAEMVECAVIFTYGITNTWMERFGSQHGDPYTVKQVQHISIAVMFWFAGFSGMLLESTRIRRFLGAVFSGRANEPPTYAFSFNPLPGLVIAVTGLAMAAHHQDYVFQVAIHSLWGLLLAGGSAFRLLTYTFLWLRPPTESVMPSRPPTEVLTAFGWAAGGIVFMLSDEEVTFAAMRTGFDDVMAFLNFTIALTCFVFCWVVVVLGVKGYAVLRQSNVRTGTVTV